MEEVFKKEVVFGSLEPFHLGNGCVRVLIFMKEVYTFTFYIESRTRKALQSLYRESTDSLICTT